MFVSGTTTLGALATLVAGLVVIAVRSHIAKPFVALTARSWPDPARARSFAQSFWELMWLVFGCAIVIDALWILAS